MKARSSAVTAPSPAALHAAFAASLDGVVVVDRHGVIVFANPAAMRMMRAEGSALVGTKFGHQTRDADLTVLEFPDTGTAAEIRVSRLQWEGRPARLVTLREVTGPWRTTRRSEAMAALLDQAERVAHLGSIELDLRDHHSTSTSGLRRVIGRAPDRFLAEPGLASEILHPDDRPLWQEKVDAVIGHGESAEIEVRLLWPDGEVRIVRAVAEPVTDRDGRTIKVRFTVQDITEQRRSEESFRETYRLLEAIADNTPANVAVTDRDGRYLFSNAAHCRSAGHSREELAALTLHDLMPPHTADQVLARATEALTTGVTSVAEESVEHFDGTQETWLVARFPVLDDHGRPYAAGFVALDITEQKQVQEAQRRSAKMFRLLADNSHDVIFLVRMSPHPTVEYVSPAAQTVLGYAPEELTGDLEKVLSVLSPTSRRHAKQALRSPSTAPAVYAGERRDGTTVWLEVRISAVYDEHGEIRAYEGNLRDISDRISIEQERERLARQLEQTERLESLGRLAGGVAHDINNLLAVVLGAAEFLAEDLEPGDPRLADVERISQSAQRGAAFTRQLLIFSRREPSVSEALDLNTVIAHVEDIIRPTIGPDVESVYRLSPDLPSVCGDSAKLEQVVLNLVFNARAAMPEGGRLVLRTDHAMPAQELHSPSGGLPAVPPGDYVRLTVADTGVGMTPEVARRAFEPFFTTGEKGTASGLGLATVHGVVTEMNGHIRLESRPGQGTTFEVYLPVDHGHGEPTVAASQDDRDLPQGRGETVLVVEDEEPVLDVVTRILSRHNYRLLTARNAAEALQICRDRDTKIDLLLTDVIMPGISGYQLGERLRGLRPDLPVIYMSGYSEDLRSSEQHAAGAGVTLSKPFEAATVLRRVRDTLDSGRPRR